MLISKCQCDERKSREKVSPLQKGDLTGQDMEKAEELSKSSCLGFHQQML